MPIARKSCRSDSVHRMGTWAGVVCGLGGGVWVKGRAWGASLQAMPAQCCTGMWTDIGCQAKVHHVTDDSGSVRVR